MRFIELFAGIGGFRYGLEEANHRYKERTKLTLSKSNMQDIKSGARLREHTLYTCVWANEIDKYACRIYRKNFGEKELYEGDIRKVKAEDIPDHDLITTGFPCQAFSIAGKRGGFMDVRGTLFFEIVRVAQEKQPRLLLLENVKGLLSHNKGRTFGVVLSTLDEIGYDLQWQVLNSKNFGVPQNRERVFIIGHLRGTPRPEVFPIGYSNEFNIQQNKELPEQVGNTLRTNYGGGYSNETYILDKQRKEKRKTIASCLSGGAHSGGNHSDMDLIMRDGRDNRSCLRSGRIPEVGIKGMSICRLTPTECERLQSFPDGWTEKGLTHEGNCVVISDTQRYKSLGNAITCSVVTEIGKRLLGGKL